jgi:hypothetical protein
MKQRILVGGLVILVIGVILLLLHAILVGIVLAVLGALGILGGLLAPATAQTPPAPTAGLDAVVPGQDPTLNEPIIPVPNAPGTIMETYDEPVGPDAPPDVSQGQPSEPPHPPASY